MYFLNNRSFENYGFSLFLVIKVKQWKQVSNKGGFSFFLRRSGKISSGVQATPLSKLWQGLGVWVKDFHTK
jgi:hypothetical protein